VADLLFVLLTIAVFAVLAVVARGVERLWTPRTWSAWCWPSRWWCSSWSRCCSRSAS